MAVTETNAAEPLYLRRLPGGGFVSIGVMPFRTMLGQRRYRGEVVVEQRGELSRRQGHRPPAVAFAEADSVAAVFRELFPVAQSNTAIANAVVTHRRSRTR